MHLGQNWIQYTVLWMDTSIEEGDEYFICDFCSIKIEDLCVRIIQISFYKYDKSS